MLDAWLRGIGEVHFMQVLPLLRRTFSQFPPAERRQIGERLKPTMAAVGRGATVSVDFDLEAALAALPILKRIWNIGEKS
jgi:hypothetical protein